MINMEQRVITQIKVYYLVMNSMTERTESANIALMSDDKEKLINYYTNNLEYYQDGNWSKSFKKGSFLEWYNPLWNLEENNPSIFGHGLKSDWVDESHYFNNLKNKFLFI